MDRPPVIVSDDATAAAIVDLLGGAGAAQLRHVGDRRLLDHLLGTYFLLRRWGQPPWLCHAGLLHSVYSTDAYRQRLLSPTRRAAVAAVAGAHAERIAFLFCVTPRRPLFAGTHLWARGLPSRPIGGSGDPADEAPSREELDALVLLHMANLAEQAHAADGRPGRWLVRVRDLAEFLTDSDTLTPPPFVARLGALSDAEETVTRRAYLDGLRSGDQPGANGMALAAAVCPVIPEPCVWLAHRARGHGDSAAAASWAAQARRRLVELGIAWDRRLSFEEWLALIDALERGEVRPPAGGEISHPRDLLEALVGSASTGPRPAPGAIAAPDAAAGRQRFHKYVEALDDGSGPSSGAVYPDLPSRPWHDPREFSLVDYLETNFAAIRDEILTLDGARFHRESERIARTGDWDVAFFYERGRRHDDVCTACPVTTEGIEAHRTVRTMAGLIYVSRMRPATHIAAHRGPTNLRLRCHLGIEVPPGDCAIRVGERTERWQEGKCLVFDDHFEHEAWNHTDRDRIVLIVDLWHPGLSATEVTLLEGLHRYTYVNANRLSRYWAANARSRG
ncbi:MAG TPA: aspartyl/asparaginyl beta-hydroxylase domain-containing protein [Solirubrobacteraceae bacterium]|jgi:aspartate beta-hydroxylase